MRRIAMYAPRKVTAYFVGHNKRHSIYVATLLFVVETMFIAVVHVEAIVHLAVALTMFGHETLATIFGDTRREAEKVVSRVEHATE